MAGMNHKMRRARKAQLRRQRLPEDTPTLFVLPDDKPKTTNDKFCGEPQSAVNYGKR